MCSKFPGYGIVLSICAMLTIALVMLGCGSGSSNSSTLSPSQAQTIATAVSNGIGQGLTGAFGVAHARPGGNIVQNDAAAARTALPVCLPSGSAEVCSWTVSSTYSCQGGGSIGISGNITGSLNNGTGSAQVQIGADPANCSVNGITLNGNPKVNLAAQINILNDNPVWPVTGTETGGVTYGPTPSGSCQLNLSFSVSSTLSCTVTGTACGQPVSGSC